MLLLAATALLWGGVVRAAPVLSEVAVAMNEAGQAKTRRMALNAAKVEAVKTLVVRHLSADQRTERGEELREAYYKNPEPYVLRFSVLSEQIERTDSDETLEKSTRYRVGLRTEINRKMLLSDLRSRGFEVSTLPVLPRLLLVSPEHPDHARVAEVVRQRFDEEGFDVSVRVEPMEGGASPPLAQWGREAGAHVVAVLQGGPSPTTEELPPAITAQPIPPGEEIALAGVVMRAKGWLQDVRTGQLLSSREADYIGRDSEPEQAAQAGLRQAAERLFHGLMADLVQSGWTMGEGTERLELRVGGLDSPALVEHMQDKLAGLAEFRKVSLDRVEPGTAVWRVEATQSDYDWPQVLSQLAFDGGEVVWTVPMAMRTGGQEPTDTGRLRLLRIEGQWLNR